MLEKGAPETSGFPLSLKTDTPACLVSLPEWIGQTSQKAFSLPLKWPSQQVYKVHRERVVLATAKGRLSSRGRPWRLPGRLSGGTLRVVHDLQRLERRGRCGCGRLPFGFHLNQPQEGYPQKHSQSQRCGVGLIPRCWPLYELAIKVRRKGHMLTDTRGPVLGSCRKVQSKIRVFITAGHTFNRCCSYLILIPSTGNYYRLVGSGGLILNDTAQHSKSACMGVQPLPYIHW